jgi:hypothetical protein
MIYQVSGASPTRVDGGTFSRGGWEYSDADGGPGWAEYGDSFTNQDHYYYMCIEITDHTDNATDEYSLAYFSAAQTGVQGRVRLNYIVEASVGGVLKGHFQLQIYDSGAWATGTDGSTRDSVGVHYVRVHIDDTDDKWGLYVNNVQDIADTTAIGVAPILTYRVWEDFWHDLAANDGLSSAVAYTSASSGYHVGARYPVADVPDGKWRTKNCGPHERFRWTAVDDVEDDDRHHDGSFGGSSTNHDHIYSVGDGTNRDQMFEVGDIPTTCDVVGVAVDVIGESFDDTSPTGNQVDAVLAWVPSEHGSATPLTGQSTGGLNNSGRYVFMADTPNDATEWNRLASAAVFNELRVGVRNSHASATRKAYTIIVHYLATNVAIQTHAARQPGPASPALGSANPMVY